MAQFTPAYNIIKLNEGGYANVENDKGGETYAGISRKFFPSWSGWKRIDEIKMIKPIRHNAIFPELIPATTAFYKSLFDKYKLFRINNQDVANLLFDYIVHSGATAIKAIQKLVNVAPDGAIGEVTINAINLQNPQTLFDTLKKQRINFLKSLIEKNPTQKKFESGWLKRMDNFKFSPLLFSLTSILLLSIIAYAIFSK